MVRDILMAYRARRANVPGAFKLVRMAHEYGEQPALAVALSELGYSVRHTLAFTQTRHIAEVPRPTLREALVCYNKRRGHSQPSAELGSSAIMRDYAYWHGVMTVGHVTRATYRLRSRWYYMIDAIRGDHHNPKDV